MANPDKLRELAAWYREFAERAGNPAIWEARLQTAEDLEREAALLERGAPSSGQKRTVSLIPPPSTGPLPYRLTCLKAQAKISAQDVANGRLNPP